MQAAIEARAVTYRTRAHRVTVRDISLTVGHGELVAIIGSSGSGKTTLLEALCGLCPPTSGTVRRLPDRQVGYVPAGDSLPQVLPLARALRYTAALRGVGGFRGRPDANSPGDNGDSVDEALDMVGLASEADVPLAALNPGERKRAEIAAELLAGPAALFLDEPTTALDPAQATQLLRLLRGLSDTGAAVLLTTSSPLDAGRCDKVAVLATGGHLAFFGTPGAACGYFGADSLDEIYERLSGLGDPAAAWSRRFFYFFAAASGSVPVPTLPRAPGPALLIPDQAGPHSAGRPGRLFAPGRDQEDRGGLDPDLDEGRDLATGHGTDPGPERERDPATGYEPDPGPGSGTGTGPGAATDALRAATGASLPVPAQRAVPARPLKPARQLPVLVSRNAEILARDRSLQAIMAAVPLATLLLFCLLLVSGALDGPAAVTLAWGILGGLVTGLAYELPVRAREAGVLRRESFTGVNVPAFLAAKAALLLPALAVADLIILAVPAVANRLQAGFGISYLTVFAASVIALAAATAPLLHRTG